MRIALIVPEFPPATVGGGGVVFKALAEEYALRHEVLVLTADYSLKGWRIAPIREAPGEFSLIRYPLIPVFKRQTSLRTVLPPRPSAVLTLRNDLRKFRPHVAHLHGFGYSFVDVSARLLCREHVPFVFTNHGYPATQRSAPAPVRLAYRIFEACGPARTEKHAQMSTVVSGLMSGPVRSGRPAPQVVENALTPLPPPSTQDALALRRRLRLGPAPIVSAAGRLSHTKGFDVLLQAIEQCDLPHVQCVIAGDDNGSEDELRRQAQGMRSGVRVLFPGRLGRAELGALFTLSDVVVVPSRAEPFGLVALEALGLGRRVITSAVGQLPALSAPPLGRAVPPEDPSALATEIACAIRRGPRSPSEEAQMRHVLAAYQWGPVAKQYEALLSEALQLSSGRSRRTGGGRIDR
jgi:glycosyltransferase involved in cell wall biosynthesis